MALSVNYLAHDGGKPIGNDFRTIFVNENIYWGIIEDITKPITTQLFDAFLCPEAQGI